MDRETTDLREQDQPGIAFQNLNKESKWWRAKQILLIPKYYSQSAFKASQ